MTNCNTSDPGKWFNACQNCKKNFVHGWSNNAIDYTCCVEYSKDANCAAYDSGSNQCKLCKPGFALNLDFLCIEMKGNRCEDSKFVPFEKVSAALLPYYLYAREQGAGCNKCSSGYSAVKYNTKFARYSCSVDSHITTNIATFAKRSDNTDS